jgi:hypothetical protein
VTSINQPKTLIVIEGYDVVVTSDRARLRGQDMRHEKLRCEAGGREVNEATSDNNTIGNIRKKRNIMARSRNYCCNENEIMRYLCIVQLRIDAKKHKDIWWWTTMFLWRIYVAGNNETCRGLRVKCLIFSSCQVPDIFIVSSA